jgi:hypothetical protein
MTDADTSRVDRGYPPIADRARKRRGKDRIPGKTRVGLAADLQSLSDIDGRFRTAKRFRAIVAALVADAGGAGQCAEAKRQLIRRFGAAAVLAEALEARLAAGEEVDIERHALLCSTLCRLAARIGTNRVPREIAPLDAYLEHKYGRADEADDVAEEPAS